MTLKRQEAVLYLGQRMEVVRREDLALHDREIDLDLIEPTGMDGPVHKHQIRIPLLQTFHGARVWRAVRFVRHHASGYGINAMRIGLMGESAGGHLAGRAALGPPEVTREGDDLSEIEQESARVQVAVLGAAPTDLRACAEEGETFLCRVYRYGVDYDAARSDIDWAQQFAEASPVTHVSPDDPPTLLYHGDLDDVVPYDQAPKLKAALRDAGVPVKLLRVRSADHDLRVPAGSDDPNDVAAAVFTATVEWFDRYLIQEP